MMIMLRILCKKNYDSIMIELQFSKSLCASNNKISLKNCDQVLNTNCHLKNYFYERNNNDQSCSRSKFFLKSGPVNSISAFKFRKRHLVPLYARLINCLLTELSCVWQCFYFLFHRYGGTCPFNSFMIE